CFVFKRFKLGGNKTLCIFQRLSPLVVYGCVVCLAATDFNVISVDAVVADFQSADSGALTLSRLQLKKKVSGVAAEIAQLIQLRVISLSNDTSVAYHHRGVVHQR